MFGNESNITYPFYCLQRLKFFLQKRHILKLNKKIDYPIKAQAIKSNNSLVFCCIKISSPRDSTFNLTNGSVLEHRKLNRQ